MIDTVQAVLLFVIVLLTILFVVLGIQIFLILKDLRQTIRQSNKILEDVEKVSGGVSNSFDTLTEAISSASILRSIANILTVFKRKKE